MSIIDMGLYFLDYAVLFVSLLMASAIGVYFGCRPGENGKMLDYLLANRQMAAIPVAFSIGATVVSGSSMVGIVSEVYMYGWQYLFFAFGATLGILLVSHLIIPMYLSMNYISIYEYVERRFHISMRIIFSLLYVIARMLFITVALYIPAISLSTLTPIPHWVAVLASGSICVTYCVIGGMKAVIWTDVLQALLMLTSYILMIACGTVKAGGVATVWNRGVQGYRIGIPKLVL